MSSFRAYFLVVIIGAVLLAVLICAAATVAPLGELQRLDEQGRQNVVVR